jgi:undecaprenyl diphosphate synthase
MDINLNHVAIILDGNGRWAKERGLNRTEGHKKGYENLKSLSKHVFDRGIKYLSIYAFSTENFKRSEEEVDFLMNLFIDKFKTEFKTFDKENIKIVFSGRKDNLSNEVLAAMDEICEETKNNDRGTFNVCLNYGGQHEIVDACNKIIKDKKDSVSVEDFAHYLYQDLPPVDFMIRTSGEERISNFMLFQCAYAEMYFPKIYFPDFNNEEFDKALEVYKSRDRRFGGIKK